MDSYAGSQFFLHRHGNRTTGQLVDLSTMGQDYMIDALGKTYRINMTIPSGGTIVGILLSR
jgi:hypothetical protein